MPKYKKFIVKPIEVHAESGRVLLNYAFDKDHEFIEDIDFGRAFDDLPAGRQQAFESCLNLLAVAAGISYYKAFVPPEIELEDIDLSMEQALFFQDFYYQGLGEFAARNELDLESLKEATKFTPNVPKSNQVALELKDRPLVLIGGGKDSNVTIEALRDNKDVTLLAVNPSQSIKDCIAESDLPAITISRKLDPKLFVLNESGALNGHVPITGIISLIALAATIIYDYNAVVLSNERSADQETMEYQGERINHQYSKSFEVERQIAELVGGVQYFSFLRPLSELHIARLFAKSERYDHVFTSCNGAHKLQGAGQVRWCLDCPKCHFTYLMLATAMTPDRLERIFGKNLLDDPIKLKAYRELCGLEGHKPWECVGELEESAAAFYMLAKDDAWKESHIVQMMYGDIVEMYPNIEDIITEAYTPSSQHLLASDYKDILDGYLE